MSDEILLERLLDESYPGFSESERQLNDIRNKIKDRLERFEEIEKGARGRKTRDAGSGAGESGFPGSGGSSIDLFGEYNRPLEKADAPEADENDPFFDSFTDGGAADTGAETKADAPAGGFAEAPSDGGYGEEYSLFDNVDVFKGVFSDDKAAAGQSASAGDPGYSGDSGDQDSSSAQRSSAAVFSSAPSGSPDRSGTEPSAEAFSGGEAPRAPRNNAADTVVPSARAFVKDGRSETRPADAAVSRPAQTIRPADLTGGDDRAADILEIINENEADREPQKPVTEGAFEQGKRTAPVKKPAEQAGGDSTIDRVRDRLKGGPAPKAEPQPRAVKPLDTVLTENGRDGSGKNPGSNGNTSDPAKAASSVKPADPAKASNSVKPADPAKASDHAKPVKPANNTVPANPAGGAPGVSKENAAKDGNGGSINPERDQYNNTGSAAGSLKGGGTPAAAGALKDSGAGTKDGTAKAEDRPRQNVIRVRKPRKYQLPPLDLVKPRERGDRVEDNEDLYTLEAERNAEKLKTTLRNFGIGVRITGITRGPVVTRFEFKPDEGIKISRIVALTNDIALSLAASAVRMEAPIPGKPAIGIEIPNKTASTVYIYDVLNTNEYKTAKSKLSVALGKDIDGRTVLADLNKMPHLLIAGSTGSGKSVCINTLIMGILFSAAPDEVKFIMIDPKVVELGIYNNIPHLLIPVVTEPRKASAALAWAVAEVERRYILFAENNVRDLANYNRGIKERPEMAGLEKLPQIVIIIDELADLMMAAPQDVERSVIRLAQKARAAGVHLVIATQRPSVDVITGIIKANIPSRIAFAVASQIDSRTILDTIGAEKLLGRGDMLYHPLGFTKSVRVQCAFVSDEEVERVVGFIRNSYGAPEFDDEVTEAIAAAAEQNQKDKGKDRDSDQAGEDDDQDSRLIREAAELALSQGCISTSSLQRRMRLGYGRAARIIDSLEIMGLLSGSDGSRPRQVLMTKEQWKKRLEEENV